MNVHYLVFSLLVLLLADYGLAGSSKKSASSTSSSNSTKVSTSTTTIKSSDKLTYPKKVSALKKRPSKPTLKKVADITEKFKDLPADDLAFIKELDKQFKLHGGKVKIKVENDNVTMAKNSKRTIEGELGYGYSHNGYDYSPPKYMFYPYSQQDISHNAPKYYIPDGKTEVSIEPSYSYELKPQTYIEQQHIDVSQEEQEHQQHQHAQDVEQEHQHSPLQHHQQQQQQYEEPVIVLRIPGPAKYASHLQTLLQQYLEIRAAQYLKILEETEHRQHQQQQQHHQQELQQVEYTHGQDPEQIHHQVQQQQPEQPDYQHQQQVQLQYEPQQQPQYPDIDHVYQHYKYRQQSASHAGHQQHQQHQPEQQEQAYYVPSHAEQPQQQYLPQHEPQPPQQQEQPQFYYTHQQEYAQPAGPPANTYQHIYLVSMASPVHAGYEPEHIQQEHIQAESPEAQQPVYVPEQEEQPSPVLTENNPRSSHTKVIFTQNVEHAGADYTNMYPLPSIKPNERHAPKSVPDYHQDYQEQPHPYNLQQESIAHEHVAAAAQPAQHAAQQQMVAITQRPYNYHAHNVKQRYRTRGGHKRRAVSAQKSDDHDLQKIRDYVRDNLGARTGTQVEYETKTVIEG